MEFLHHEEVSEVKMAGDNLRLIVVTPERTLLDEPVAALRFPLYDGDIGILPGRLPLIGRLGAGELRITASDRRRATSLTVASYKCLART